MYSFKTAIAAIVLTFTAGANADSHLDKYRNVTNNYPLAQQQVYELIVPKLSASLQTELLNLQQEDEMSYQEVMWELYDMAQDYRFNRIESGVKIADLQLRLDLLDLEALNQAELYLDAQDFRHTPAVAEYEALQVLVSDIFDLDTQLLVLENQAYAQQLSSAQKQELEQLHQDRLAMRGELIQRMITEYLEFEECEPSDVAYH